MSRRVRVGALAAALAAALALPASAWAHAVLLRATPTPNRTASTPPRQVALTYSEAVEPRFAIVSVTDALGHQDTSAPPRRSPQNVDTLLVPLKRLGEGWYLVYWRVVSVDGHPVRGAFTFAVGPNPGPQPEFAIPSTSETAATPRLLAARSVVFAAIMAAIGLFVLRMLIARPLVRRVQDTHLRWVSGAFVIAAAVGLMAAPVYALLSTADFALRSVWDIGSLVPLMRASAFGRGMLDLELCFALFVAAALVSVWVDRPDRPRRSAAELLALTGALAAGAATLLVPGLAGHAGQTSPRGAAVAFDWLHLVAGSVWVGGLAGLLVLWRSLPAARRTAGLVVCVPRFSNVAFVSVLALIGSGIGASLLHLPTLATLWNTSYGQALLVKIGLLAVALVLAAVNLLRTTPRLRASPARPELGPSAVVLLRRLVSGETLLVLAAVTTAAVLSSLAPPSKALAQVGSSTARVGPGPVAGVVDRNGYRLQLRITPNRAAVPNVFALQITRGGSAVRGARVTASFEMLDMEMGQQAYQLDETAPGVYTRSAPALVMVGHWGLSFRIEPPGASPFTVLVVDRAGG